MHVWNAKAILSDISIATPAFSPFYLQEIYFSIPLLLVCVYLSFWGGCLVDSICMGLVFLSVQLPYVF